LIAQWFESQLSSNKKLEPDSLLYNKLEKIKHESILNQLQLMIENHPDIALESIDHLVQIISHDKLKNVIQVLTEKLNNITKETE
jgi:hypothetical protein